MGASFRENLIYSARIRSSKFLENYLREIDRGNLFRAFSALDFFYKSVVTLLWMCRYRLRVAQNSSKTQWIKNSKWLLIVSFLRFRDSFLELKAQNECPNLFIAHHSTAFDFSRNCPHPRLELRDEKNTIWPNSAVEWERDSLLMDAGSILDDMDSLIWTNLEWKIQGRGRHTWNHWILVPLFQFVCFQGFSCTSDIKASSPPILGKNKNEAFPICVLSGLFVRF